MVFRERAARLKPRYQSPAPNFGLVGIELLVSFALHGETQGQNWLGRIPVFIDHAGALL